MRLKSKILYTIILYFFMSKNIVLGEKNIIFDFNNDEIKNYKKHSIKGNTNYTIIKDKKGNYLRAEAKASASGLGVEKKINLNETPYLNIVWKLERGLEGIKEDTKKGHDFALRVFVIKSTGKLPWQKKVINYVFSSNKTKGDHWKSPYTKQSVDYALSSLKSEKKNQWISVKTNVKNDFLKIHNLRVDSIDGIAVMSDTDNSKLEVIGYYQNIYFSSK